MIKLLKNKKGITMIEMVVGMLVFSIIAISVTTILVPVLNAYSKANDLAEINTLLGNLSAEILDDLARSTSATVSDSGTKLTITTNANTIVYDIDAATGETDGFLCRNGIAVLHEGFYKNKTVSVEYCDSDGATLSDGDVPAKFYVRLTLTSSEGTTMASRDYAVNLLRLRF